LTTTRPAAEARVKSIPAPETEKLEAAAPSIETAPVESIVIPPVPASTSIPPSAAEALIRIELAAAA